MSVPTADEFVICQLLVFAAFSYPFNVLPLAVLCVFLLAMAASYSRPLAFRLPVFVLGIGITGYAASVILPQKAAYREWQSQHTYYQAEIYKGTVDSRSLKSHQHIKFQQNNSLDICIIPPLFVSLSSN